MHIDKCDRCGDSFGCANDYVWDDGLTWCFNCFAAERERLTANGTHLFWKHVPGAAFPNTVDVFTFYDVKELMERLNDLYGSENSYSVEPFEKWSVGKGSYVMLRTPKGENWCIGYINCDVKEL